MRKGHKDAVEMMCSIGELAGLFQKSGSLDDFLQTAVSVIAWHMRAAVCSIFLLEPDGDEMILVANQGWEPGCVGRLRISLQEGMTGLAVREQRAIRAGRGGEHPAYKSIQGLGEEKYQAFLAVPIIQGRTRIGALLVQDPQPDYFNERDERALTAIAIQLASVIENTRLLLLARRDESIPSLRPAQEDLPRFIKGQAASPGLVRGHALSVGWEAGSSLRRLVADTKPRDTAAFEVALHRTEEQLDQLQRELARQSGDIASLIFSAHLLILKDRSFTDPIRESLRKGQSAQDAILDVFGVYERMLQNSRNPRIREKSVDLEDVTHRLMGNLLEVSEQELNYENRIAIARNMTPSEILKLAAQKVAGLVLLEGGFGAHVAILARSIRIPLLVVSDPAILRLKEEDFLILDAEQGSLCIRPTAEVIAEYNRMEKDRAALAQTPAPDPGPAHTREGERIHLLANMNLLSDLPLIHQSGAEGIGLYRSEFPFLVRDNFPSEEEQTRIYRTIVEGMGGKPITFRTLDIGGDKTPGYMRGTLEANPVLGVRAIRFSLKNEPIFKQQIRAMLRATHDAELRMMFPMISSLDELREVRRIVRECEEELRRDGFSANQNPKIGIMVEVPAAAECIVELTDEVDFMSIGSNDLIQYILAVDRTNPAVADLYQSSHPAVLRAVARIVAAARDKNREISLCGDMAGELRMIPFLIGIGLRRLSVEPGKMNEIRTRIREISAREGENLAKRVLSAASCAETARCLAMK